MTERDVPRGGSVAEGAAAVRSDGARRWILIATILGSSMAFIDMTVVNVALPALQRDLRATAADVLWVVEAYALFLSALILVGGAFGDRFGRRRVFAIGVTLFAVASAVCGLAQDVPQLIIARAVQGIGGALLTPGSLAILTAAFPAAVRGKAIGTWSAFTTITSALGPVLGGWLISAASWRWIFLINLPLAAITLAIVARHVPESRDPHAGPQLDWPGVVLATLGLGGLVFGLITGGSDGFGTPMTLVPLVGGVVALAAFVVVEARSASPMLPLRLFRSRTFSGTNLLTLLLYGALGGALYFLPFNLQQVQGYSAAEAGASLLPFTLILFGLSRWAGGLVDRYGAKLPLIIGPSLAACGFVLFAILGGTGSYWLTVFPAVAVLGLGMAVTVAPLTTAVMGSVGQEQAGIASGVNNAVARTASLLALAVLGIAVLLAFQAALDSSLAGSGLSESVRQYVEAQRGRLAAIAPPTGASPAEAAAVRAVVHSSYMAGFRVAMLLGGALAALSAVAAALLVEGKAPQTAPAAVRDVERQSASGH